ncbi:hypothetical protein BWQ96_10192 [Gracilariopsis chorda]|uniref:Uncharacterized protein n=1 Tax=Gracilariopsis chorda TaxID=448386 RepID=A0A2V3IDE0_9FLOR|nr:hypothetical protein BWQ96_10192 [Gracilariopsis chorda]|eukprot:PXF40094.1 hypothetical protein BWQ96_10192 [Gracilariopsis chorda]
MRGTQQLFRATQTLASTEASRLVAEAAKRASQRQKKSRGLRKYGDLVVAGLATLVAGTAVKNKYKFEEDREKMEMRIQQLEEERDEVLKRADASQQRLMDDVNVGVIAARRKGEEGLRIWLGTVLKEVSSPEEIEKAKPKLI